MAEASLFDELPGDTQVRFGMSLKEALKAIQESEHRHYVYILYKPDGVPFYVGKGKGRRVGDHMKEARGRWTSSKNSMRVRTIRKIMRRGGELGYGIDSWHQTDEGALTRECTLIAMIGRRDIGTGPLTNVSTGGESPTHGPESCRKVANAKSEWHARNRELSRAFQRRAVEASGTEEWRAKQSVAQKKWNQENPEACRQRQANLLKAIRSSEGRKRNSESKKKYIREHPEAIAKHAEFCRRWREENPEHFERMIAAAKRPDAIRKMIESRRKTCENDPEILRRASAKVKVTCGTKDFREAARRRLIRRMRDHPEEFAERRRKRAAKVAKRTAVRLECERLIDRHKTGQVLPDRRAALEVWEAVLAEVCQLVADRGG